ncbi:MAG: OmpA family protein [Magnetococcales bacterium]|nr:OmpA family protein [Magnetococcales bacterium]
MRGKKLLPIIGLSSLALALSACAPTSTQEGWMNKGFNQWHPQSGQTSLATVGTQCYFCSPADKPERQLKIVEADTDGDGVPDSADECPKSPMGMPVDIRGCPLSMDRDNDGVADSTDDCPNTPAGAQVDAHGCWALQPLFFGSNSSKLQRPAQKILKELLLILKDNPKIILTIRGYADNSGNVRMNRKLAERRARSVERYLIMNGIAKNRLVPINMGTEEPAASNSTRTGRAMNRRVELTPSVR